jgi:hypothetical protein
VLTTVGTYASVALAAPADTVANARDATAAYQIQSAAAATGYELLTDADGIACIDDAGMGGMGVHFVKGALVSDPALDPARPEALVYEVTEAGQLHLVALEWVVIQSAWDSAHNNTPPTMFGQKFNLTQAGNRFGLPAYYSLHAWIWKDNPAGMFAPYNPRVECATNVRANSDSSTHAMPMHEDLDARPAPSPRIL